jgi:hypothetical protein
MGALFQRRCASWNHLGMLAGVCAAALLVPSISRAADPVEQLRDALKIDVESVKPDLQKLERRKKAIEAAISELKSISQLRRAFFLKEWQIKLEKKAIEDYRAQIGASFTDEIRKAAEQADPDQQLAIAILIAEIADNDLGNDLDEREKQRNAFREKFARAFAEVTKKLVKAEDLPTRQAALHALGKIAADPAEVVPILKATLQKDELGPRRLAAYALSDVVRNARFHKHSEVLAAIDLVVSTAASSLIDDDELIRGYCLQAIQESAKALADQYNAEELVDGKLPKEVQKVLRTYQAVNAHLLKAVYDPKIDVRLTAVQALDQINVTRSKMIRTLDELAVKKEEHRGKLLMAFDAPDPLGPIIEKDLKSIARLLTEDDVRLRQGAMDFLELLDHQAEPVAEEIFGALGDSDRFVRLSTLRTIRNLPTQKVNNKAIRTLAMLLREPDSDLSKAAAEAIEAIGPPASDAVGALAFVIANGDEDSRRWDVENRVAAMKALVSIGGAPARAAIPLVLSALSDTDVRIRRAAAETIGKLGRPDEPELAQRATAALKHALRDDDAEVRLNASEAMLSIAMPRKKR